MVPVHPGKKIRRGRGTGTVLAASIGTALVLAACGSSSPNSSARTASSRATKSPLILGVIADETGAGSVINVRQVKGVQAWTTVVNATGGIDGHPVKLQICDSATSVTQSITCAQQMSTVGIVLENTVTGEMNADVPVLESEGKVVLTINPTLNPRPGSNLFQASPAAGAEFTEILKVAKASGIDKVGVITTSDASGTAILGAFTPAAKAAGEALASVKIAPNSVDATVPVLQLKDAGVGLIYDGVPGGPGSAVLLAAKTLGISQPVVVNASDVNADFLQVAAQRPPVVYGVPFANTEVPALLNGSTLKNVRTFEAQYKKVAGHALNLEAVDLSVPNTAQAATDVLAALGPTPTLAQAESYILHHTLPGWAPLQWSSTSPVQDAINVPVSMAEAHTSSTEWAACDSSGPLHC